MLQFNFFTIGLSVLIILALLRRVFSGRGIFRKWQIWFDGFLFAGCFLLLGYHFYQKREKAGMLAVGLGAVAIGKYLYDKSKITGDEK